MKLTLKEYLTANQLSRKIKREIINSSAESNYDSSEEKDFANKLIEIKAKLELYVLNERNLNTIGQDLD